MEEKKNKSTVIIIGVLVVLVLVLLALLAFLFLNAKDEKKGGSGNAGPFVVTEQETDSDRKREQVFEKEIQPLDESGNGIYLVTNGCKVLIPKEYSCMYVEEIGLVVYLDDVFQMKLKAVDGSYSEAAKNPDSLTEKTIAAGGEMIEPVKETEVNGRKYLYFLMELSGDKCLVIHSQAADSDKRIAGQIVMESNTVTSEDMIYMFAGIAESLTETDEPDTTSENIMEQLRAANTGKVKSESTLSKNKKSITFKVPAGYYSVSAYDAGDYVNELFATAGNDIEVDCCFRMVDDMGIDGAKGFIESWFDWLPENVRKETEIQSMEIEENMYYYYDVHYKLDGDDIQNIVLACDVGDDMFYTVEAESLNEEGELTIEAVQDFLLVR